MVVGEAPGAEEERQGRPFCGASGLELDRMMHDAGLMRTECFVTNVCRIRPTDNDISRWIAKNKAERSQPNFVQLADKWVHKFIAEGFEQLKSEIALVKPKVIIACGNVAMWALTGKWGITDWRGSQLTYQGPEGPITVLPVYHPAAILRQWSWRQVTVTDLRRVHKILAGAKPPEWKFVLRPNFSQVMSWLQEIQPGRLCLDIETRQGHIACFGLARSKTEALCIPLMCAENPEGYWTEEQEAIIVFELYRLLTRKDIEVVGQNLLYDCQYIWRHWLFNPHVTQDTMISQHTAFAGLPKALDFLASMYCEHYVYWKDDGKEWTSKMDETVLWRYNCEDCVRTFEVGDELLNIIKTLKLEEVHQFQQDLFWPVLSAMNRGLRIESKGREQLALTLQEDLWDRDVKFTSLLGHSLNPKSPLQLKKLFYEDLGQKPIIDRKTGSPSCNEDALAVISQREPILRQLVVSIAEYRRIGVFLSTFVQSNLDADGRMRCSFNICGTETYRFSSSQNAFGSGMNLQNIPKDKPSKAHALAMDDFKLPNIRKLFVPDDGYTFFDLDLDRADLQVVSWEADDDELKAMLREGVDMHTENAKVLGCTRQTAKTWVHGTNYGGSARTMAVNCGLSVHQSDQMRLRWFSAHPGIASWHSRTEAELRGKRCVTNKFGYRRYYFDRVDGLLPEALAWIPQSTVACVINRALMQVFKSAPYIHILLQVHDSIAGQFPTHRTQEALADLKHLSAIMIPYPDPLTIPVGIKISNCSWGDCE